MENFKQTLLKKPGIVLIAIIVPFIINAQNIASGYVYEDHNQNGIKDRSEKGIADVAVTNGEEVVLTNKKGIYKLPVGEDNIISVIKPSDYQVPVNEDNLPQFFYIHKPGGSPDLKYSGVAPTGKLLNSVDFGLISSKEKENFTALIFGDPQPYSKRQLDFFSRGVVAEVEGIEEVSFGLSLGDLVGDNLNLFKPYIKSVEKVGIPWYNLMGNHDRNSDVKADSLADETFEAHFGPANYSFNQGKVHFIILENTLYPDPRDGKGYWGGFREDQLRFIENDLKFVPKDYLIVLAFHIPLGGFGDEGFRKEDREKLFTLLKDFPNTLSLSAHTHIQKQVFYYRKQGWKQDKPHHHYNVGTTSGSWHSGRLNDEGIPLATMRDGTPKGYAFIHFSGNDYVIDYKAADHPVDYRMNIYAPKVVAQNKKTNAGIYVNFFMGGEMDKVAFRVKDGEWKTMHRVQEYDPGYIHLMHEWDHSEELLSGRRPPNFKGERHLSTHLWRSGIPTNLPKGTHIIEVKVTDMFGREFRDAKDYRVE